MATGFLPDLSPPGAAPLPLGKPPAAKSGGRKPLASPRSPAPKKRPLSTSAKSLKGRR